MVADPTWRSTAIDTSVSKVLLSKADLIVFPFLDSSIILAVVCPHLSKLLSRGHPGRSSAPKRASASHDMRGIASRNDDGTQQVNICKSRESEGWMENCMTMQ